MKMRIILLIILFPIRFCLKFSLNIMHHFNFTVNIGLNSYLALLIVKFILRVNYTILDYFKTQDNKLKNVELNHETLLSADYFDFRYCFFETEFAL